MAGKLTVTSRTLIAGSALLSLTGCLDMRQDLTVGPDGTATLATEISIDAALMALGSDGAKTSGFCAVPQSAALEGVVVTAETTSERGDLVCVLTATGKVDRLAEVLSEESLVLVPGGKAQAADAPKMSLFREDDNYRFMVSVDYQKPKPEDVDNDTSKMLAAMVAGRSFSWSVTAPLILQTSGQLSQDGKTASYSVPLASLVSGDIPKAEFTATFSTRTGNGFMDWIANLFGG